MRSTSLLSLFGFALCLSAAVAACSGDDDDDTAPAQTPSDLGQSCTRTADCKSGLVCIDQVCEKKGTVPNAGSGNEGSGGSTGGTTGTSGKGGASGKGGGAGTSSTPPPVLGSEGESCTRAADCAMGLHCFNQRCTRSEANGAGGEGGMGTTPPPTPRLGAKGETCVVSTDCDTGLVCRPSSTAGAVGVCTIANTGITPTGKDCHAECREAGDCCQLPTSLLTNFKSCADLKDALSGIDCTDPGASASQCFVYATYCDCADDAWKCTAGACEYVAECKSSGLTTDGCPSESRSGRPLVTSCNDGHCQFAATDPTCTTDASCEDKGVADDETDHCTAGECTCYKPTGLCYRKCSVDLDCQPGKVCDAKAHVCMPAPQCATDVDCQASSHNINTICIVSEGTCRTSCASDLECNANLTGALTQVCNTDHVCEEIGCTQDSECMSTGASQSVQLFCTPKLTAEQTGGPSSAITDGTK